MIDYFEDGYWYSEPSEFEEKVDELKQILFESVGQEIKSKMERLERENSRLSAIEREMQEKKAQLDRGLRDLEYKKKNIESTVRDEFYKREVEDILSDSVEKAIVWFAQNTPHEKPKCELCNEDRKLLAILPDGEEVSKNCACSEEEYWFEPEIAELKTLKVMKRDSKYQSKREFYISKTYKPNPDSWYDRDGFEYNEFTMQHIVEEFTDETKELRKQNTYSWHHIGFTSKEECQKYCDWLNTKPKYEEDEGEF